MVSLRMIAVYLLPRFSDLLDNEKVVFSLDNPFDARLFMSGDDDEVVALLHDGCVAGGRNLDRLDTATTTALAVKGQGSRDVMLLCARLDPFVHVAEDFLVARRSFSEVHRQDPCSRSLARPPAHSAARLLEKRLAFLTVHCTPHSLPPLSTGTPLVRNIDPSLSSIDPGAAVGKQSPLVVLAARTERDGQKHLLP
jgi:hypothetical protein